MNKPRLFDLFCGAGGCTKGYQRAGFYVIGIDIKPQPNYCGDEFFLADALTHPLNGADAVHASPPCQGYSKLRYIREAREYPKLIEPIRKKLIKSGKPYVIENIPEAPLHANLMLCGTMFGLRVIRHRIFETKPQFFLVPADCYHWGKTGKSKGNYHTLEKQDFITCVGHNFKASDGAKAMGIDWMNRAELAEAIPPAYTEWIGKQLIKRLAHKG